MTLGDPLLWWHSCRDIRKNTAQNTETSQNQHHVQIE